MIQWCWMPLDLPSVPDALVSQALEVLQDLDVPSTISTSHVNGTNDPFYQRRLWKDGIEIENVRLTRKHIGTEFQDWVVKYLIADYLEASVSTTLSDGIMGPHTDRERDFVLIYLIDPGGPEVKTNFWRIKGESLHQPRKSFVDDYNRLELVESAHFPTRSWVALNSRILHSVENIVHARTAFQVSMRDQSQLDLMLKNQL